MNHVIQPNGAVSGLVRRRLVWVTNYGVNTERLGEVVQFLRRPFIPCRLNLPQSGAWRLGIGHPERLSLGPKGCVIWVQVERELPLAAGTDVLRQGLLA